MYEAKEIFRYMYMCTLCDVDVASSCRVCSTFMLRCTCVALTDAVFLVPGLHVGLRGGRGVVQQVVLG